MCQKIFVGHDRYNDNGKDQKVTPADHIFFLSFYIFYAIFYRLRSLYLLKLWCAVMLGVVLQYTPWRAAGVGRDVCPGRALPLLVVREATRLGFSARRADHYIAHFLC
ncbi:hypothetical protein E2C01_066092 [Portunus trituberculatus]|uniref:Uncharacterized protein n=1 Tax=Portunus trituberculatus TaxID=210409 RepID=A0A5B7HKK4_PORTR|nr:hypothetical protein [Portunus trituberculatus]